MHVSITAFVFMQDELGRAEDENQVAVWERQVDVQQVPRVGDNVIVWPEGDCAEAAQTIPSVDSVQWSADLSQVELMVWVHLSPELQVLDWRAALTESGYTGYDLADCE